MNSRGIFGKQSKVHILEVFRSRAKRSWGIYTPTPEGCWLMAVCLSTSGLPPGGRHSLGQLVVGARGKHRDGIRPEHPEKSTGYGQGSDCFSLLYV